MTRIEVRLCSQEGLDANRLLQSHQWAEVPAEIANPFMTGGLKKVRRMTEAYFTYRFGAGAAHVRGIWRAGEVTLVRRFHHIPFLHGRRVIHLGRLRSAGTLDVYRGYHEIRGGEGVAPAATVDRRPWPEDMPWVAPSAGEFIDSETDKAYLGIFEIRVERVGAGCRLHTALIDFPVARQGLGAAAMDQPWSPMRSAANLEFLRAQVQQVAREQGHEVRFLPTALDGTPARLRFQFERHDASIR